MIPRERQSPDWRTLVGTQDSCAPCPHSPRVLAFPSVLLGSSWFSAVKPHPRYLRVPHPSRFSAKGGLFRSNAQNPLFFTLILSHPYTSSFFSPIRRVPQVWFITWVLGLSGTPGTAFVPGSWACFFLRRHSEPDESLDYRTRRVAPASLQALRTSGASGTECVPASSVSLLCDLCVLPSVISVLPSFFVFLFLRVPLRTLRLCVRFFLFSSSKTVNCKLSLPGALDMALFRSPN